MAYMEIQKAVLFRFPQLQRQAAALHRQIIRQLLTGEGDIKLIRSQPLGLGGEVGHELGPCGALAHVGELFAKAQVLFRQLPQQVADDPAVVDDKPFSKFIRKGSISVSRC